VGILDEDVVRVREASNLVAVASEHLALKRVGRRYSGLCPFHAERTPSFTVNPEMGVYYCFGCGAKGDAITFVREVEHLDFVGAVERLAARAGIQLRYDDASHSRERQRRDRLVEAAAAAVAFYHRLLLESPEGGLARRYLRSRGIGGDVARRFQLGWAPEGYDGLSRHLQSEKFSRQDLLDAGLAFVNRANRLQDHFRSRLMFPIFDTRGDPVAFGGRSLGPDGPKYKNSPESAIYQKSRILYGLNWAKADVVAKGEVVVCEGYTDVIAFFSAGVARAVATCGTALGEDHLRILRNFASTVVMAYDADDAGQNAAERVYQWESHFEMRLAVADLPPGQDPADVGREDPAGLTAAVERARPFLQFRLDRLLAAGDLASVEGRAAAAETAARLVAEHPSDLVRDQYVMQLAERLAIDTDHLRQAVDGRRRGIGPAPAPVVPGHQPGHRLDRRELEALRVAVHEPALVADRLAAPMFSAALAREAFEALAVSSTFHEALDRAGSEARSLLERLAVEDPPWGDDPQPYALSVIIQLLEAAAGRLLEEMVRAGDDRSRNLKQVLDEVGAARADSGWSVAHQAAMQLLPWVLGSGEE
jgi:DNA primase